MAFHLKKLGIPVDLMGIDRLRDVTAIPRLINYLRRHKADLVHTQLEFSNTLGTLSAKILGLPTISTIHTLDTSKPGSKKEQHLKLMWWVLRKFNDRVLCVSEGARQHYIKISADNPKKVLTLYNGIDLSPYSKIDSKQKNQERHKLGLPINSMILTTVSFLRQPKGIQFMLQSLPEILKQAPNTHYLIVGDGNYRNDLEVMVTQNNLSNHVTFLGFREDIPYILSLSDIFVLPSLDEALPTVLAEAMAAGLPLIGTKVGGVPEMLVDGENGFLIPPSNSLELAKACIKLLNSTEKIDDFGVAGHELVNNKFNIQVQVQKLEAQYLELLST
jgi:glycosyltransferase involved in cell wall biosynthesis